MEDLIMKKVITSLIVSLLFSFTAQTQHVSQQSSLSLTTWNNTFFEVILNHQQYQTTNNFYLPQIANGVHQLKIVQNVPNRNGNGYLHRVLYNGTIHVPQNSIVTATVNRHRNLTLTIQQRVIRRPPPPRRRPIYRERCGNEYRPVAMTPPQFVQLLATVRNTSFDRGKINVIRNGTQGYFLTTRQVRRLMRAMSFDSGKLAVAKFAFNKTIDTQNYYTLQNELTFSSNRRALQNYIAVNV